MEKNIIETKRVIFSEQVISVNVEHWTPEQIAGSVQDVDVSASVIRLWARKGLIDIRNTTIIDKMVHQKNVQSPKQDVTKTVKLPVYVNN